MHLAAAHDNDRAHTRQRDQELTAAIDHELVDNRDRIRWLCRGALRIA